MYFCKLFPLMFCTCLMMNNFVKNSKCTHKKYFRIKTTIKNKAYRCQSLPSVLSQLRNSNDHRELLLSTDSNCPDSVVSIVG